VLTRFQLEVAEAVAGIAGPAGFALAGGGALIAQGLVDRPTRDLDFFTTAPEAVRNTAAKVESALITSGFEVSRSVDAESFVRLEIRRDRDECEVDLGHDARRWPTVNQPPVGAVLAPEELAADKTLALVGRAAARDFVDVRALEARFGRDRLCELAADKDPGFRRVYLADALSKFDRLDRDRFDVGDVGYADLRRWAWDWRVLLFEQARHIPEERHLLDGLDRGGPEIGF
jgi:hypothetical protein